MTEGIFGWSADYLWTLWRTVWLALVTTAACLALAYPIALFVAARPRHWRAFWLIVLMIPFCTNLVVRTYGWQLLFSPHWARAIYPGPIAVYVGMISTNLSFAVLPIYTSVERIDSVNGPFRTLPLSVSGRSSMNSTRRGTL